MKSKLTRTPYARVKQSDNSFPHINCGVLQMHAPNPARSTTLLRYSYELVYYGYIIIILTSLLGHNEQLHYA